MKVYRSLTSVAFSVYINGHRRFIRFSPHSREGSYYVSNKKAEQQAIEAHPFFQDGVVYVQEEVKPEPPKPVPILEKVPVRNSHAAREYLVEKIGLALPRIITKVRLIEIGRENNIEFVFPER